MVESRKETFIFGREKIMGNTRRRKWTIDFHAMKVLFNSPPQQEMHDCIIDVMPIEEHERILAAEKRLSDTIIQQLQRAHKVFSDQNDKDWADFRKYVQELKEEINKSLESNYR